MAQPFRPSGSRSFGSREGCAGRGEKRLARRPMTTATKERGRDGLRKALFTCHRLRDYYESLFPHESESLRRVPLYRPSRPPNGGVSFAPRKDSTTLVSPILYSFSNLLNASNFFSSLCNIYDRVCQSSLNKNIVDAVRKYTFLSSYIYYIYIYSFVIKLSLFA